MTAISLVIPAWNAEATIGETLDSVLRQTRPPEEIIVVDDGSTDGTAALVSRFDAVRLVRQENGGAAAAMNAGIAASTGDLLAFLDADDLWEAGKLAAQSGCLLARADLDGVAGYVRTFLCPSVPREQAERYALPDAPEPGWLSGALLLRRRGFDRYGLFSEDLATGFFIDWLDRARRGGISIAMLDAVVLHRRIRPGSLSHRSAQRNSSMVEMARRAINRRRAAEGRA